jgi:arylsulfatase A-like enzyme
MPKMADKPRLLSLLLPPVTALTGNVLLGPSSMGDLLAIALVSTLWTALLIIQSLRHFSRTGPQLKEEIASHYGPYSVYALGRLALWAWIISIGMAFAGTTFHQSIIAAAGFKYVALTAALFAAGGIATIAALQFCHHLLFIPSSIEASSNYRLSRFYPLWARLTPGRLAWAKRLILTTFTLTGLSGVLNLLQSGATPAAWGLLLANAAVLLQIFIVQGRDTPKPTGRPRRSGPPNILLIGVDSLRYDRVGGNHPRHLTPHLDKLAAQGVMMRNCFVPCARTAPSLASLLCSTWPHQHGIRDNFCGVDEADMGPAPLPHYLGSLGYHTMAISDWCGSDLGKFPFGFDELDLPEDQWNIRFLLRQGPKDLRLFLSLFTHNRFGRHLLPEIYFLAGVPLGRELGLSTRQAISRLASDQHGPFFINVFMSSTHAPFGSEYPYYTRFTDPAYRGDSKFVMGGLSEPFEVVARQAQGKAHFDFEQILGLYDGCVQAFDDELQRILDHLSACGLDDNTLVAVYSDHGMEFFERETWGQGNSVIVEESAKIPFVIRGPGIPAGGVVDAVTRSIDIAPTLLDLAGLPIPPHMQGVSLRAALEDPASSPELAAYGETGVWFTRVPSLEPGHLHYPDLPELLEIPDKAAATITFKPAYKQRIVDAKDRMIRTNRWKLVRQPMDTGVIYRLFDMQADPQCIKDVSELYPGVLSTLRLELESLIASDLPQAPSIQPEPESDRTALPLVIATPH